MRTENPFEAFIGKTVASVEAYVVDHMAPHRERMGQTYVIQFTDGSQTVVALRNEYDSSAFATARGYDSLQDALDNCPYGDWELLDSDLKRIRGLEDE